MTIRLNSEDIGRMVANYLKERGIDQGPKAIFFLQNEGHGHEVTVAVDTVVVVLD